MSYIGANKIGGMHLGSTTIAKAYLGSTLMYQKSGVTPALPYDAEVEYLESTGTQYIDTGIVMDRTSKLVIDGMFTNSSATSRFTGQTSSDTTTYPARFFFGITGSGKWNVSLGNSTLTSSINGNLLRHTFVLDASNKKLIIDNSTKISALWTTFTNPSTTAAGCALFGRLTIDSGSVLNNNMRIYSAKLYVNSVLVRDYIPVRVGQVGYMYDNVSLTLFGNDGTGDFTIGNDIT